MFSATGATGHNEDFDDIGQQHSAASMMGRLNGRGPPLTANNFSPPTSMATTSLGRHPHAHHQQHTMSDDDVDDSSLPTLLKRTPSGSLFIPSGLLPFI